MFYWFNEPQIEKEFSEHSKTMDGQRPAVGRVKKSIDIFVLNISSSL